MKIFAFIVVSLFLTPLQTIAQSLVINGNIVINETSSEGARVIIARNNVKIDEQLISKKGRFDLRLGMGADYKVSFEKPGYITKIVTVNTEVPDEILESNPNFPPVKLIINLLPLAESVDLSIFEQPIAILSYNQELDDFTFDKDYSSRIKDKIAQAEQNVKRTLAEKGTAVLAQEQRFAELTASGQQAFDQKQWHEAITTWQEALVIKPGNEDVEQKINLARKEMELAEAKRSVELQNEQSYRALVNEGDRLLAAQQYAGAKEKYRDALSLKNQEKYPTDKIKEIDTILAEAVRKEAEQQKQLTAREDNYQKIITIADGQFIAQEYTQAITSYQQALSVKSQENYPREMIAKAEKAKEDIKQKQQAEAEQKRIEEERRNSLRNKYEIIIAEADEAFKNENYGLSRLRYTEADNLGLSEAYPLKQIAEIDNIISSSKYKAREEEYSKNKKLAEKNLQEKNYAAAKVYYQKALSVLPLDKEDIIQQIAEIDKQIETERLAAIEKEYQGHMTKADKAAKDKAYAIAKFYYQKALDIKPGDPRATEQLEEVGKYINDRQEKKEEL